MEMNYDNMALEQLYELEEELAFRIAYTEKHQFENTTLIAEIDADASLKKEADDFYAQHKQKLDRLIRKTLWKKRSTRFRKVIAPKLLNIAVYVLFFAFITFSTAVALVPSLRYQVVEFLVNVDDRYTELSLQPTGEYIDIPPAWTGNFYLSYIPEAYSFYGIQGGELNPIVYYTASGDNYFSFAEYGLETKTNIDSENTDMGYKFINGRYIFQTQGDEHLIYSWAEHDKYFVLSFFGDYSFADAVLEKIMRIK